METRDTQPEAMLAQHLIILSALGCLFGYLLWVVTNRIYRALRTTVRTVQRVYTVLRRLAILPGNPLLTVFCRPIAMGFSWLLPHLARNLLRRRVHSLTEALKFCDFLYPLETTPGEQYLIGFFAFLSIFGVLDARYGQQCFTIIVQFWANSPFPQKHGHIIRMGLDIGSYMLLYVIQYLAPQQSLFRKPTMTNLRLNILYGLVTFVWYNFMCFFALYDLSSTVERYTQWHRMKFNPRQRMNQEDMLMLLPQGQTVNIEVELVSEDEMQPL